MMYFFFPRFGPRFPATVNTYDQSLQDLAKTIAEKLGYAKILRQGTYVMVGGPTFETVAESRLLRLFGADAVGMKFNYVIVNTHYKHCSVHLYKGKVLNVPFCIFCRCILM